MRSVLAVVPCVLLLISCVGSEDELSESTSSVVIDNRISLNRISLNRISLNRISLNRISLNRISLNRIEANLAAIGDLLDTAEGRELFSFVVSCALPEDVTLVAATPGGSLEFFGEVGLAPNWIDRPMTNADQRWVSACLLARVNEHNVTIAVSIRGPHEALATTDLERTEWTLEEGAFYGDVFVPEDEEQQMFACRGRDQAAGEPLGLAERDCTEPDPADPGLTICGMTFAGDCADFAPPQDAFTCKRFSNHGYYEKCRSSADYIRSPWGHAVAHGHPPWAWHGWGNRGAFREVITAFLAP